MLERAREHLLEDVLGIVGAQSESLTDDRIHVAGEAVDELTPGLLVARAAAGDEPGVGERSDHVWKITTPLPVE
jgi:hypothetical protein